MIELRMMKAVALGAGIATLLSGCANPQMPNDMYDKFASGYVGVQKCGTSGMISPDTALWGKYMLNARIGTYSYDQAFLETRYRAVAPGITPTATDCNQLAMYAEEYKQNVQASNAQVEATTQALQNNRPVNTYCNRVGMQTICNSY